MNILVVCHYGLYENLSFSFVHKQAQEYASLGHRVRVIVPNGLGKTGADKSRAFPLVSLRCADGVELVDIRYLTLSRFGERGANTRLAIAAICAGWKRIFGDFRPDIIHAHTLGFDSGIGAWLKERLHCPLVVTTHGSDTFLPVQDGRTELLRRQCLRADCVVAVSESLRRKLLGCGVVTHTVVIADGFTPHEPSAGTARDRFAWIQVCNLVPSKRVDVTLRAFARLRAKYPAMTLTVIGDGPQRLELQKLAQRLGIADAVRFTGRLENKAVFDLLIRAGFFIMASSPEGFGIAYLEAMNAECVTIGSEREGIADIIENGVNGFLVPPGDAAAIVTAVDGCYEFPEIAKRIAEEGKKTAAMLTWRTNAERYIELFRSVIS